MKETRAEEKAMKRTSILHLGSLNPKSGIIHASAITFCADFLRNDT